MIRAFFLRATCLGGQHFCFVWVIWLMLYGRGLGHLDEGVLPPPSLPVFCCYVSLKKHSLSPSVPALLTPKQKPPLCGRHALAISALRTILSTVLSTVLRNVPRTVLRTNNQETTLQLQCYLRACEQNQKRGALLRCELGTLQFRGDSSSLGVCFRTALDLHLQSVATIVQAGR